MNATNASSKPKVAGASGFRSMLPYPSDGRIRHLISSEMVTQNISEREGEPHYLDDADRGDIDIDGWPVGRWVIANEALGEGGRLIVGAMYVDDRIRTGTWMFRKRDFLDRYRELLRERDAMRKRPPADNPEKRIEDAIADRLRDGGHSIRQQVKVASGIPDIVDDTAKVIVECKAGSKATFIFAALEQLERYEADFPGYRLALGLPSRPDSPHVLSALEKAGIEVFTPDDDKPPTDAELENAEELARFLHSIAGAGQLPTLISWLEGTKPKQTIAALRRIAA